MNPLSLPHPRILLLLNGHAGKLKQNAFLGKLIRKLKIWSHSELEIHLSTHPGFFQEIVLQKAKHYDLLICVGGDGSVNEVINGLLKLPSKERTPLALIPAGTTCDYAKTLGYPENPLEAIDHLQKYSIQWVDTGLCADKHFVYVASFGAFSEISYKTPLSKKQRLGSAAYLLEGLKSIPALSAHKVKVCIDKQKLEGNFLFGAVVNSCSIGGLIKLAPSTVSLQDGFFECLLLKDPPSPLLRPSALIQMLNPEAHASEDLLILKGRNFSFSFDSPIPWTLDGEYGGSAPYFKLQVEGQSLPLLLPAPEKSELRSILQKN